MNKIAILSGAAVLAVAGGVALAQTGPAAGPSPQADVTRAQVAAHVGERFARLDANRDGRVTRAEGRAARQAMIFDTIDANHDGNVSRAEFAQARPPHGPGGPHMGRRHGLMGPPPGGPDGPPPPPGAAGPDDPGVTLEQMRTRALARFDRADANHDGTLTAAERQDGRGHRGGRRRG